MGRMGTLPARLNSLYYIELLILALLAIEIRHGSTYNWRRDLGKGYVNGRVIRSSSTCSSLSTTRGALYTTYILAPFLLAD